MYRIGLTPNFEGQVDLSIAINDPDIPTKERVIDQMGALSARVDCIHDIPVERPMFGVREYKKIRRATHSGNWGRENPVSKIICNWL